MQDPVNMQTTVVTSGGHHSLTGCFRVIRPEGVQATWQREERDREEGILIERVRVKKDVFSTEEQDRRGKRMCIRSRGLSTTELYIPGKQY